MVTSCFWTTSPDLTFCSTTSWVLPTKHLVFNSCPGARLCRSFNDMTASLWNLSSQSKVAFDRVTLVWSAMMTSSFFDRLYLVIFTGLCDSDASCNNGCFFGEKQTAFFAEPSPWRIQLKYWVCPLLAFLIGDTSWM